MDSPKRPRKEPEHFADLPERIRPELNIEKWSIWQPANARTALRERVFERTIETPDGGRVTAKLTVAPTTKGNLTTEDQRVYYALVKLWEERGRGDSFVWFSLRGLAAVLKRTWSHQTMESLRQSLMRLRMTGFIWEKSFEDGSNRTRLSLLEPFNLLDDLKIVRRDNDGHVTKEAGYFRFHSAILKNLLANHTKPVFYDIVLSFRSEIAQLLYTYLDLILSDKMSYERRTKDLFEDLGLEGKDYHKPSARKRRLEPALKELEGKPLTTGTIAKIAQEPTKDGDDFKLVVRKGQATKALPAPPEQSTVVPFPAPATLIKEEQSSEAADLVRHFHRVFHGLEECYPGGKTLDQARVLLARHGGEKARYIVEFAHREAPKTGYKVATFGGVMQYESRAIKDFERQGEAHARKRAQEQAEKAKRQQEAAQVEVEEKAYQDFWESLNQSEQEAFKNEAIKQAPPWWLNRYRQTQDKSTPSAQALLKAILKDHFYKTRPSEPSSGSDGR